MQHSWCKNANPKPAGFGTAQTRVSDLAKCPGFPGPRFFSKPGFQSLMGTQLSHKASSSKVESGVLRWIKIGTSLLIFQANVLTAVSGICKKSHSLSFLTSTNITIQFQHLYICTETWRSVAQCQWRDGRQCAWQVTHVAGSLHQDLHHDTAGNTPLPDCLDSPA